jgi:hypothetical protein
VIGLTLQPPPGKEHYDLSWQVFGINSFLIFLQERKTGTKEANVEDH